MLLYLLACKINNIVKIDIYSNKQILFMDNNKLLVKSIDMCFYNKPKEGQWLHISVKMIKSFKDNYKNYKQNNLNKTTKMPAYMFSNLKDL